MKKNIMFFLIVIVIIIISSISIKYIFNKKNKPKDEKTIKVAEVTHSVFYTPFYVAIENGFFKEEGLDIELLLVSGSDNVAASVLSGDTDVGLAGPESAIYVYLGGEKDYLQVFSGLTKRDGQFIIGRDKDFNWRELIGKEILVGRSTGMPALSFFKALENKGIAKEDIIINTSIEFAELAGTFIGGTGDYVNLFEPLASNLEKKNQGYVLESVGLSSNEFPYTAFYARKSDLSKNKNTYVGFTKAIAKGLKWTLENDSLNVAKVIKKDFAETKEEDLTIMIDRYKDADVWLENPIIKKDFYQSLVTLLKDNNLIKDEVYYSKLINNLYE